MFTIWQKFASTACLSARRGMRPYRTDLTDAITPGANRLEIKVVNSWVNRLIGDRQPEAAKVTFTALLTYNANTPLRPSGLVGPVWVLSGRGGSRR